MTNLNSKELLEGVSKAPWKLDLFDPPSIASYDGELVVDLPMWQPEFHAERDANARLIASAPRLAREHARMKEALDAISSQAICYGMAASEPELRDWLRFISETAEAALTIQGEAK